MRSLITGGSGFIGSHLVDKLLHEGHEVIVLDNMTTGRSDNLAHCSSNSNLTVVNVDITNIASIQEYFKDIDWVFHIAALADIVPSIQRPRDYFHANVQGTLTVVEAAKNAGVRRLIYAASSSCYGQPDVFPTSETAPIRTEYPYALTKYLGEEIVLHWSKVYKLPAVSLRFFNVFGPRSRTSGSYGAVFGVFLAQKLANQPFTIVGDGTQTRDFTFVTDVVDACIAAAGSDLVGEAINVGSGGTYSVNYLAELLGGQAIYIPKRPGEPDCTFADIAKIQKLLLWEPRVSFEQGVAIMLDNLDDWITAPVWTHEKIADATREWFQYLEN